MSAPIAQSVSPNPVFSVLDRVRAIEMLDVTGIVITVKGNDIYIILDNDPGNKLTWVGKINRNGNPLDLDVYTLPASELRLEGKLTIEEALTHSESLIRLIARNEHIELF